MVEEALEELLDGNVCLSNVRIGFIEPAISFCSHEIDPWAFLNSNTHSSIGPGSTSIPLTQLAMCSGKFPAADDSVVLKLRYDLYRS